MVRLGLLIVSGLLAAGATGLGATALGAGASDIAVTRESLKLPSGCTPREVGLLLSRFTDSVNAGDQAALARLFVTYDPPGKALEPAGKAFRWYSVTETRSSAAQPWRHSVQYDRADLLAYFAERHEQNERIALIEVIVGPSRLPQAVGLTFKLRREADDLPSWLNPFAYGKGGIDCAEQAIYLWSMGQADRDPLGQICPRPPGWKPGVPVVACSRGRNALALSPEFRAAPIRVDLPARCRPVGVRRTLASVLAAFNVGLGDDFARRFVAGGQFHPYTASISGTGFIARARISRFVRARYLAGDGWTATRLFPPRSTVGLPTSAVYGIEVRVAHQGALVAVRGAKLVVDCASGLLRSWIGPSLRLPPS